MATTVKGFVHKAAVVGGLALGLALGGAISIADVAAADGRDYFWTEPDPQGGDASVDSSGDASVTSRGGDGGEGGDGGKIIELGGAGGDGGEGDTAAGPAIRGGDAT